MSYVHKIKTSISKICELDFFAMRPSDRITFENKTNYSTTIGKFASWVLIGLSVLTFIGFGGDMMYRKNPQSTVSQIVTPDPEYLNLPNSGFFMAFGLQDLRNKSTHYIDETIYNVSMIQRVKIGTSITLTPIPISRCSVNQVPDRDDLKDYFGRNQINNLYCISNESEVDVALQSNWDGPLYRNVLINIYPCKNNSNDPKSPICKSPEVIQAALNSANYAMYFTNLAIDPSNYEKPITSFGKQLYTPISASTLTYIEMQFGHISFISDNGYLFQDLNSTLTANYLANRQILSFNPNMVVQIDLKLDKIKMLYYRSYDKIQSVLANMGGIIKAFTILANLFVLPFVKLKFKLNLANSLFNFKLPKRAKELKNQDSAKVHKYQNKSTLQKKITSMKSMGEDSSPNLSSAQQIKEYFRPISKKLYISSWQHFFAGCMNEMTKLSNKLLNKGISRIDQVLDISYIMNKLTELEVLKALILDHTQKDLFEYIPKPEISLEEQETQAKKADLRKEISQNFGRRNSDKAKSAYEAFYTLAAKEFKSPMDEKLLELVPKLKKKAQTNNKMKLNVTKINHGEGVQIFNLVNRDLDSSVGIMKTSYQKKE